MENLKTYKEDKIKNYGTLAVKLPMNGEKFTSNATIFSMSKTTQEQAISNYINLLLTAPGERFMQPNFGVGLRLRIFEQMDYGFVKEVEEDIKEQSSRWLPYIYNDLIDVDANLEKNEASISIKFRVTESGANQTINIFGNQEAGINIEVNNE